MILRIAVLSFAIVVALFVNATPDAQAQKKHPAEEKGVARSFKGEFETVIEFVNNGTAPVKVFWLNLEGKRELVYLLNPGERQTQKTFLNHPWLLADEKDNAIGIYYPDVEKRIVTHGSAINGFAKGKGGLPANPNPNPFGGRVGGKGGFSAAIVDSKLTYLGNAKVLGEMKLSDEQKGKMDALAAKQKEATQAAAGLTAAQRRAKASELAQEADKEIAKILNKTQDRRLEQIMFQEKGAVIYSDASLLAELKPTAEQKEKLDLARTKAAEALTNARNAGPVGSAEFIAKLVDGRKAAMQLVLASLNDEQKKVWDNKVGSPFDGFVRASALPFSGFGNPPAGGFPGKVGGPGGLRGRDFDFNNWTADSARWLNEPTVQDALKMTPDQITQVGKSSILQKGSSDKFLTPFQQKKYIGIYLQVSARTYGPAGVYRYREVLDELKLTDDQRTKVLAIGRQDSQAAIALTTNPKVGETLEKLNKSTEKQLDEVLTPNQRAQLRTLLGDPFNAEIRNPLGNAAAFGKKGN